MTEKKIADGLRKEPLLAVFTMRKALAMEEVSKEDGLLFKELAGAGESYISPVGSRQVVPPGYAFIILGDQDQKDMTLFWEKVGKKC